MARTTPRATWLQALVLVMIALLMLPQVGLSQSNVFVDGWTLQPGASSLKFQSVKNLTVVESSGFATFSGAIDANGTATVKIALDSVDTKVDLRNVRMRFLFFETFQFPEAIVTVTLDPGEFADLPNVRRKIINLPYTLSLHGLNKTSSAEVAVTLISDDLVAVSTSTPISVAASEYALDGGVTKLEEAANVVIVPSATVTFDFVFARNNPTTAGSRTVATTTEPPAKSAVAALETQGNFDQEACKGRFEILSRTGNIYFGAGSARLDEKSAPLLDSLGDIIARCPGMVIEVAGHTDSDGSDRTNLRLSKERAASVTNYLVAKSIPANRIVSVGYGESRPVFPNDSAENKRRNRRIEFSVINE